MNELAQPSLQRELLESGAASTIAGHVLCVWALWMERVERINARKRTKRIACPFDTWTVELDRMMVLWCNNNPDAVGQGLPIINAAIVHYSLPSDVIRCYERVLRAMKKSGAYEGIFNGIMPHLDLDYFIKYRPK